MNTDTMKADQTKRVNVNIIKQDGTALNYRTMGFSGGERHIQIEDLAPLTTDILTIRAAITSADDLMDLLLIENALNNHFGSNLTINLELPYLPYSRQDRVCAPGQAFSLQVMTHILNLMKLNKLVTWDCHSNTGIALTNAINVQPVDIIQADEDLLALFKTPKSVLICPDKGAVDRCTNIKQILNLEEIVFCEKRRDPNTGMINKTDVLADDLSGKCAIISDDICDGGYTFIKIAEQLRKKNAEKIVLFVTHGIFSKGLDVFDGLIDRVITTNSFPQKQHPKLSIINFEYDFGE